MKALTQFYPFIEPDVMGCPYPVIDHHLRMAAREFCQRTSVWREWLDPFAAPGTINRFDYDLSSDQELVKVVRALRNEDELTVMAGSDLPPDWATGTSTQLSDALVHFDDREFMVFPVPDSGDLIRLEMSFRPTLTATSVGDVIYTDFADDVATGCKARLKAMTGKDWADAGQALDLRARFDAAMNRAANRSFAKRGTSARRTKLAPM